MGVEERVALLKSLEVEVTYHHKWVGTPGVDRHEEEVRSHITGVQLPFAPHEWCNLCMREGDYYFGGCCGNMGVFQDHLNAIFRDSGYASDSLFLGMMQFATDHEGFELYGEIKDDDAAFAAAVARWKQLGPIECICVIYAAVEPALHQRSLEKPSVEDDPLRTLERGLASIGWKELFGDSHGTNAQSQANMILTKAKILDPLRKTLVRLESERLEFSGFGMFQPGTDEPLVNGGGPCLYARREEAEYWLELANRHDEEEEAAVRPWTPVEAEILPFTVTLQGGLRVQR